jgi:hypothetical protein
MVMLAFKVKECHFTRAWFFLSQKHHQNDFKSKNGLIIHCKSIGYRVATIEAYSCERKHMLRFRFSPKKRKEKWGKRFFFDKMNNNN